MKKIKNYQIFSVIFTFILGTLLHFTYKLSSNNAIVASFSAINESTWEHLKLFYFPMLITLIIGYFYFGKTIPNFICSKTIGIITAMLFTVVFFYTYTGILGTDIAFIDISLFFVSSALGEYIAYKLINNNFICNNIVSIVVLIFIGLCFVFFTYFPPNLGIFENPIAKDLSITAK